ncbi:hypothetical protein FDP41_011579 [Naegleria fowleri]|uniref:Uncharacterized protein n=1 Tax=Naegleria fowleri TaxID=5763 RepID=A0A6A5CBK4_NAEFO|nr:uncharacterized protein FDP41_011579 [Naegleria fowleri]KAF0982649.1 hypothetical protein FDP41_011579 [Naegleria fowleri]CAG4716669.1 unnamed protein product [Naegleria fowleri]
MEPPFSPTTRTTLPCKDYVRIMMQKKSGEDEETQPTTTTTTTNVINTPRTSLDHDLLLGFRHDFQPSSMLRNSQSKGLLCNSVQLEENHTITNCAESNDNYSWLPSVVVSGAHSTINSNNCERAKWVDFLPQQVFFPHACCEQLQYDHPHEGCLEGEGDRFDSTFHTACMPNNKGESSSKVDSTRDLFFTTMTNSTQVVSKPTTELQIIDETCQVRKQFKRKRKSNCDEKRQALNESSLHESIKIYAFERPMLRNNREFADNYFVLTPQHLTCAGETFKEEKMKHKESHQPPKRRQRKNSIGYYSSSSASSSKGTSVGPAQQPPYRYAFGQPETSHTPSILRRNEIIPNEDHDATCNVFPLSLNFDKDSNGVVSDNCHQNIIQEGNFLNFNNHDLIQAAPQQTIQQPQLYELLLQTLLQNYLGQSQK